MSGGAPGSAGGTGSNRDSGRRRNLELVLLLFAIAACGLGDADAEFALHGSLPGGFALQVGSMAALALVAHLVVRRWAAYADPLILPITVLLSGVGLLMIHRLDYSYTRIYGKNAVVFGPGQIQWLVIGTAAFIGCVIAIKHHRVLQRYTYVLMAGALVLLMAPAFFTGDVNGAKRWIRLGGLSVEPDEFTKIAIIVFFASYLMANRDALALVGRKVWGVSLPRGRNLGPIIAIWAVSMMVLIFEVDLGTSLIVFGIFIVMLYMATERTGWVVVGTLMAAGGAFVVGSLSPHVGGRVAAWLHPMDIFLPANQRPPGVISDQPAQALFALGHGGFLGTGLGQGQPWLIGSAGRSDWILATFGEELGTAGIMVLLLLYIVLAERSMRAAIRLSDPFGKLLAGGLGAALILQVFVVAGGVVGLIPETGKALPFLAQGGSSMVANWLMVALMIKLSDAAGRADLEPAPDPAETLTISAEEIAQARAEMEL
ncbi:cell division protein FtsW (lipid II flippase) [Streptacidiphilus sp. MAP12-16]|uniref:FtsW/RodA/SpoVE family cell cycle protein n=1 Tax=Streptacidiphilus sp. MAP12-16 TaxID=3156300 RepID=UPI003511A85E